MLTVNGYGCQCGIMAQLRQHGTVSKHQHRDSGCLLCWCTFDVAWDLAAPANNLMITELLGSNFAAPTNQHPTYQSPRR